MQANQIIIPCITCGKDFDIQDMKKDLGLYFCGSCYKYFQDTGLYGQILDWVDNNIVWTPVNKRG